MKKCDLKKIVRETYENLSEVFQIKAQMPFCHSSIQHSSSQRWRAIAEGGSVWVGGTLFM